MRRAVPFLVLALCTVLSVPARADQLLDRVAAVVNGKVITLSDVEKVANASLARVSDGTPVSADKRRAAMKQSLSNLIDEQLIQTQLEKKKIDVTDADVDRAIARVRQQNGMTTDQFRQALVMQGYTWEGYRKQLKQQLERYKLLSEEVQSHVEVSAADVQSYLKQHGQGAGAIQVRARHILIKVAAGASPAEVAAAKTKAIQAMERITKGGEPFAKVAREVSQDPGTAKDGGDLGWFGRGLMVPAFDKAVFSAKPGQVVGPVRTRFGWHVIQVEATRVAEAGDDKDAVASARRHLFEQALERGTARYLKSLRQDAVIDIKIPGLAP